MSRDQAERSNECCRFKGSFNVPIFISNGCKIVDWYQIPVAKDGVGVDWPQVRWRWTRRIDGWRKSLEETKCDCLDICPISLFLSNDVPLPFLEGGDGS